MYGSGCGCVRTFSCWNVSNSLTNLYTTGLLHLQPWQSPCPPSSPKNVSNHLAISSGTPSGQCSKSKHLQGLHHATGHHHVCHVPSSCENSAATYHRQFSADVSESSASVGCSQGFFTSSSEISNMEYNPNLQAFSYEDGGPGFFGRSHRAFIAPNRKRVHGHTTSSEDGASGHFCREVQDRTSCLEDTNVMADSGHVGPILAVMSCRAVRKPPKASTSIAYATRKPLPAPRKDR